MIRELFHSIEPYLQTHGYFAVGLILLLENMGIPLPGELILITAGVLAATGGLDPFMIGIVAIFACILGDNVGYALGKYLDQRLLKRYEKSVGISEKTFASAKSLFLKWGPWTVFFGRFIALFRILSGPLAGLFGMQWSTFLLYNCLGAVVWVSTLLSASFYFGKGIDSLIERMGFWAGIGAIILAAFIKWRISHKVLDLAKKPDDIPLK